MWSGTWGGMVMLFSSTLSTAITQKNILTLPFGDGRLAPEIGPWLREENRLIILKNIKFTLLFIRSWGSKCERDEFSGEYPEYHLANGKDGIGCRVIQEASIHSSVFELVISRLWLEDMWIKVPYPVAPLDSQATETSEKGYFTCYLTLINSRGQLPKDNSSVQGESSMMLWIGWFNEKVLLQEYTLLVKAKAKVCPFRAPEHGISE